MKCDTINSNDNRFACGHYGRMFVHMGYRTVTQRTILNHITQHARTHVHVRTNL